jgi:hypothetical protein
VNVLAADLVIYGRRPWNRTRVPLEIDRDDIPPRDRGEPELDRVLLSRSQPGLDMPFMG